MCDITSFFLLLYDYEKAAAICTSHTTILWKNEKCHCRRICGSMRRSGDDRQNLLGRSQTATIAPAHLIGGHSQLATIQIHYPTNDLNVPYKSTKNRKVFSFFMRRMICAVSFCRSLLIGIWRAENVSCMLLHPVTTLVTIFTTMRFPRVKILDVAVSAHMAPHL